MKTLFEINGRKKSAIIFSFLILIVSLNFLPVPNPTIFLIGDSTMADKPLDDNPERGWGQLLPLFFNDGVTIDNHARNGRSTKSFVKEGRWQTVLSKLKSGDYVFIQFGHNDSKISDTNRYAEPHTTYKQYLIKFVQESRSKNAIPVLLTPVNRRKFNDEGKFIDQHGDYPVVVREVAAEYNVPLIDAHKMSEKLFTELGPDKSEKLFIRAPANVYKFYPKGKTDNTHFNWHGAKIIASLVADGIKKLDLPIAQFLETPKEYPNIGDGKVVGLDYFYNNEWKTGSDGEKFRFHYIWEDKTNSGYYKFGSIFEQYGAFLSEVTTAPADSDLARLSVYIIVDPDTPKETEKPNYIKNNEIDAVERWVKNGGVLLLMSNDAGNCEFEHLNKLAGKFGITFNEVSLNRVEGKNYDMGKLENFPDHPLFKNLNKIYMKEISTMNVAEPANAVLTYENNIVIASAKYGEGYVLAIGDPWIYNEYIDHRRLPEDFQNYEAAENLAGWLLANAKRVR